MRYLRIGIMVAMILSAVILSAEGFQDLTSEGKKNLRSANMHLGGQRIEKALPLYLEVVEENPNNIEALKNVAGIYFDYKNDYYAASDYFERTILAIDKELAEYEKLISENPKKEKKYRKKMEPLEEDRVNMVILKASCWSKLFVKAQTEFLLANDFYNLQPQTLDLTDQNNIMTINGMLKKIMADTINVETLATEPVTVEAVSEPFDNLIAQSISEFEDLYEFAPDSVQTLKMLSYAYNVSKDDEKSLEYLIKVAELDKTDVLVRQQIANSFFSMGNFEEALQWFQSAAEIDPENTDSFFNMGVTLEKLKDTEGAFNAFAKVVELDPSNLDAILHASNLSAKIGKKDESIEYLKMAIELDPGNINYLSFISYSFYQAEEYEDCITYAKKWYEADNTAKEAAQLVYQSAKTLGNTELEKEYETILRDMQ